MSKARQNPTRKRKKRARSRSVKTKKQRLSQLAGYHLDGVKIATLREVLDPSVPTKSLPELTEDQRVNLVLARLRNEPETFRIGMIGPGVIDKTRAIAEVEARSRIGRTIIEVEQNLLLRLTRTS